jgi:hypothetical protein
LKFGGQDSGYSSWYFLSRFVHISKNTNKLVNKQQQAEDRQQQEENVQGGFK